MVVISAVTVTVTVVVMVMVMVLTTIQMVSATSKLQQPDVILPSVQHGLTCKYTQRKALL